MSANTSAFAALTRYGSRAPPAPRAFMAFHRPGAMKPTIPMTNALNSVVRYQVRWLRGAGSVEGKASWVCSFEFLSAGTISGILKGYRGFGAKTRIHKDAKT